VPWGADGAGELPTLEPGGIERFLEEAAGFVEQVFESLRGEHGVDLARHGRLHLFEVEIGQRLLEGLHEVGECEVGRARG